MQRFIDLNGENIAKEHICCALTDKPGQCGASSKKEWLKSQFDAGLVFKKADVRGKVFIEYMPAEKAWVPIDADGYYFINCLWVAGSYQGQGYGKALLEECIKDAKAQGRKGLVIVSSAKKRPFLSDKKFLQNYGFQVCDQVEPHFELLCLKLQEDNEFPKFKENARTLTVSQPGLVIYYSHQCPFCENYIDSIVNKARDMGIEIVVRRFERCEEAQNAPCPATTFSVFYDGKFITHEIMTEKKMETLFAGK